MNLKFSLNPMLLILFSGFLYSQIDSSNFARFSALNTKQKQLLIQNTKNPNFNASQYDPDPTTEFPKSDILAENPSEDSFEDRNELLGEISEMEKIVSDDIEKLENDLLEIKSSRDNELLEALDESRSLLNKIKDLKRSEIERRAEEYAKSGFDAIKPFGYDLFASNPSTFAPGNEVPMPSDYRIGPGDLIEIQLFGKENSSYSLQISRKGLIQFPSIGPINAFEKGTSFIDLKNHLREKISESFGEGTQSSIDLGGFRSIRIFLMGEVRSPGAYTVSALSSMINALLSCGGIKETGSLRKIELKRSGKSITTLDLYDLLLTGNTSGDLALQPGDVIFVPVVRRQVSVSGSVKRPAKYELMGGETLSEAISLAGGPSERSVLDFIRLERLGTDYRSEVRNLNLKEDEGFLLAPGDLISIGFASSKLKNSVSLIGACERVGDYEWKPGLKIGDLIKTSLDLSTNVDLNYGLVRRKLKDGKITCINFSPSEVISNLESAKLELSRHDVLYFFKREPRQDFLKGLIFDLRSQSSPSEPAKLVKISGVVHFPGEYPITNEMTVQDLIIAAGGAKDSSFLLNAELTRMVIDSSQNATTKHINIPYSQLVGSDNHKDFLLSPYDNLSIKPIPAWRDAEQIELLGEVKFEGNYSITDGESLKDVLIRAGNLTEQAFPEGALFSRIVLRQKEEQQRLRLILQLESDLANTSLGVKKPEELAQAQSAANSMLERLKRLKPVGRLVIDLKSIVNGTSKKRILAKAGDRLFIPSTPYSVSVSGEVQFPTSHLYDESLDLEDYLNRSGGFTANADKDRTFIVKASGAVLSKGENAWFNPSKVYSSQISRGDVIVVPVNIKQSRFLENLSYSTQIVYQLAVAAAAVNSF